MIFDVLDKTTDFSELALALKALEARMTSLAEWERSLRQSTSSLDPAIETAVQDQMDQLAEQQDAIYYKLINSSCKTYGDALVKADALLALLPDVNDCDMVSHLARSLSLDLVASIASRSSEIRASS